MTERWLYQWKNWSCLRIEKLQKKKHKHKSYFQAFNKLLFFGNLGDFSEYTPNILQKKILICTMCQRFLESLFCDFWFHIAVANSIRFHVHWCLHLRKILWMEPNHADCDAIISGTNPGTASHPIVACSPKKCIIEENRWIKFDSTTWKGHESMICPHLLFLQFGGRRWFLQIAKT